jgi:ribonuclease HI
MKLYQLYTDGAYQADVQIAGIGGHCTSPEGETVFEFSQPIYDGFKYHESQALVVGLKKALEHGIVNLQCFSDDISFRNILNKSTVSIYNTNPFREELFALKNEFDTIVFQHLPRNLNKKADKLAGKILRIHNEDTLPNRTRKDFFGQENKYLHVKQLVCAEDYEDPLLYNTKNKKNIIEDWHTVQESFFIHTFKNDITIDNIDDNNSLTCNIYFVDHSTNKYTQLSSHTFIQKKLTSFCLEYLTDALNQYESLTTNKNSDHKPSIGLGFYSYEQPLQKVDMLLRRRGVLPMPDTPLTRKFLQTTDQFEKIVLHNCPEIKHLLNHNICVTLPNTMPQVGKNKI